MVPTPVYLFSQFRAIIYWTFPFFILFYLCVCVFATYCSPLMLCLIYWKESQGSYDLSIFCGP